MRRPRRRPLAGWHALDRLPTGLLPAGPRAVASLPPPLPRTRCTTRSTPASSASPARSRRCRDPRGFAAHLQPARQTEWVVYAKPPFAGPQQVLDYVGRYTHRVAISNQRLLDIDDGHVRFRYKDYRADRPQTPKTMTLAAPEFIRRFLLHVLPTGFHRIRYYGFLGNRHRTEKLARCRQLLGTTAAPPIAGETRHHADYRDRYEALTGVSLRACPVCHGRAHDRDESLLRGRPYPALPDTS